MMDGERITPRESVWLAPTQNEFKFDNCSLPTFDLTRAIPLIAAIGFRSVFFVIRWPPKFADGIGSKERKQ